MIRRIKGMHDILPPESEVWRRIEESFIDIARQYGYSEARTPIIEQTELFVRSIGETTDIVEKEMFTFTGRHDVSLSLRPEGTASMVRAYIENKVARQDPVAKWVYLGPMYRYERPQKGRHRQFFQLGVEAFGISAPEQDVEVIAMGMQYFQELGIESIELQLNSLGDMEERSSYRERLVSYLNERRERLCPDCLRRLSVNPMRVLDCKVEGCIAVAAEAPVMLDHLGEETRRHFDIVLDTLARMGIEYTINSRIVRGLDYYNRTAFEFKAGGLGAQDAVGGGGRYDGLVESLGGPQTPAVGFALGVERIAILVESQAAADKGLDFYLIPVGESAKAASMPLAGRLRRFGLRGEIDFSNRRLKHLFARAERRKARYVLIMGDEELEKGTINVKKLLDKSQKELSIDDLTPETLK